MVPPPPRSPLFPYTTLFRSPDDQRSSSGRYLLCDSKPSKCRKETDGARGCHPRHRVSFFTRSEEHTSELQSRQYLVCRLLLEKKNRPPLGPDQRHRLLVQLA